MITYCIFCIWGLRRKEKGLTVCVMTTTRTTNKSGHTLRQSAALPLPFPSLSNSPDSKEQQQEHNNNGGIQFLIFALQILCIKCICCLHASNAFLPLPPPLPRPPSLHTPEGIGDRRRQLAVGSRRLSRQNETKRKSKSKTGNRKGSNGAGTDIEVGKVNGAWAMSTHGNCKDSASETTKAKKGGASDKERRRGVEEAEGRYGAATEAINWLGKKLVLDVDT